MPTDIKTTDLAPKAAPVSPDVFMVVDVEDTTMALSGTNKKTTLGNIAGAIATILGLGSASTKAATGAGPAVASVNGPVTVGHVAAFADTGGTLTDGGPAGGGPPAAQPAHAFYGGPAAAPNAVPAFRALVASDVPAIPESGVINLVADLNTLAAGVAGAATDAAVLHKSANLSDLANVPTARTNLGLVASATTDTTNAANISSGTLPAARLPTPTTTTPGGIRAAAAVAHQWVSAIDATGTPILTQPAFSDLGGSVAPSQMPPLSGDVTTTAGGTVTTLAATAVAPGTYAYATVTVDQKGRVTAAAAGAAPPAATVPGGSSGQLQFNSGGGFAGVPGSVITNPATAASGFQYPHLYVSTIQQSGTAGYHAYFYDVTETSRGSGPRFHSTYAFGGSRAYAIDVFGRPIFSGALPAPTLTLGNGAGAASGATGTITGNDCAGWITITTGTSPTPGAVVLVFNFGRAFFVTPCNAMITPASSTTVNLANVWVDSVGITTGGFTIYGGTLAASTVYRWHYRVHG